MSSSCFHVPFFRNLGSTMVSHTHGDVSHTWSSLPRSHDILCIMGSEAEVYDAGMGGLSLQSCCINRKGEGFGVHVAWVLAVVSYFLCLLATYLPTSFLHLRFFLSLNLYGRLREESQSSVTYPCSLKTLSPPSQVAKISC